MKRLAILWRSAVVLAIISILACVTINIYFPAEKVESVAGEIVQDIRGIPPGNNKQETQKDKNSSLGHSAVFASLVATAWAQDVTTVSNPTIRTLKQQMKKRYPLLKPYFRKGILKEADNGYVSVADTGGLGLKERRDLTSLVEAENKDRSVLYQEVAKALNIDAGQVDRVAGIFAKEWQKSLQ